MKPRQSAICIQVCLALQLPDGKEKLAAYRNTMAEFLACFHIFLDPDQSSEGLKPAQKRAVNDNLGISGSNYNDEELTEKLIQTQDAFLAGFDYLLLVK